MKGLITRLRRSLTARMLLVFIALSLLLEIVLVIALGHAFANNWRINARPHLEQYLDFIHEEIGDPPSAENAQKLADRIPVNIYIKGPDIDYSTTGKKLEYDDDEFDQSEMLERHKRHLPQPASSRMQYGGNENHTLLKSTVGEFQVFYELQHLSGSKDRRSFMVPILLCVLGVLCLWFWLTSRMLRPIGDIKKGVQLMGQGQLDHRVPVKHNNDLGELSNSINNMAVDIQQMLDAKRQLLLGASHELRSPITRAKIATELLDDSREKKLIAEDLVEMEELITDILESERMKSGHTALDLQSIDIEALIKSVVSELHADQVVVHSASNIPAMQLDETRMKLLFRNLISNAIVHSDNTPDTSQSPIEISIDAMQHDVKVSIADNGPGIPQDHLDKVTEPFYRADASRTRNTGGFGLGLHLAKLIAEAHGGLLHLSSVSIHDVENSQQDKSIRRGTTATVTLPLRR